MMDCSTITKGRRLASLNAGPNGSMGVVTSLGWGYILPDTDFHEESYDQPSALSVLPPINRTIVIAWFTC